MNSVDIKNKIICGDALLELKKLPNESIDCAITSPPYWALRDYGVKGQLGLEPTFQEYITKLCDIFDEVKRVLKKEGTCWVNIGDTYASGGGASRHKGYNDPKYPNGRTGEFEEPNTNPQKGATEKSLCQIPSRFAIEMTNRGWILRNKIIWNKPNCMPSSAEDRFTVDFEEIFFFVKSKKYYFEQQLEKAIWAEKDYRSKIEGGVLSGGKTATGEYATKRVAYSKKVKDSVEFFGEGSGNPGNGLYGSTLGEITPNMEMGLKNKRTVWRINTKGYSEAHFATYPEALVEPMIKAGCPKDGTVLDIFMGSGTTAIVALQLDRKYLGVELNEEYIKIAQDRIKPYENKLF